MSLQALKPQRILCMYVARFGDTLLMSVVLKALAKQYPGAQIDFLGHAKRIQVLENLPFIHHLGPVSKKLAQIKGWCAQLMGRKPYDIAFGPRCRAGGLRQTRQQACGHQQPV